MSSPETSKMSQTSNLETGESARPLYARIREIVIARISSGEYAIGARLPSENALAAAEGVSPGTARKAIDGLAADGVLRRHQGKGTFVAEQTEERAQYRFFRLTDRVGRRMTPEPGEREVCGDRAAAEVARKLGLAPGAPVWRIARRRSVGGRPALLETIVTAQADMPGLDALALPNALYPFYQARFGLSVATAEDAVSAIAANARDAAALGRTDRPPLLMIERVARDLAGRAVEWRCTRCLGAYAWTVTLK